MSIRDVVLFCVLTAIEMTTGNAEHSSEEHQSDSAACQQSYALVPYSNHGILSEFYEKNKTISIPGIDRTFKIKQNWEENGVAGVVWEAAKVLSEYLNENHDLRNRTVLELGAGTGLVGMVAAHLGANVVVTDLSKALPLLKENIELNFPFKKDKAPKVSQLEWGGGVDEHLHTNYDFILGADIIYLESTFDALVETLHQLTRHGRKTKILLSSKRRYDRVDVFNSKLVKKFSSLRLVRNDQSTNTVVYECT